MRPAARNVIEIFLQPGDFYFGDRDTRIRTLLGSCVSITMWHPRLHVGGMCHFMLPERGLAAVRHCGGQRNVALKGAQAQTGRYFIVSQAQ